MSVVHRIILIASMLLATLAPISASPTPSDPTPDPSGAFFCRIVKKWPTCRH